MVAALLIINIDAKPSIIFSIVDATLCVLSWLDLRVEVTVGVRMLRKHSRMSKITDIRMLHVNAISTMLTFQHAKGSSSKRL